MMSIVSFTIVLLIRFYQYIISPFFLANCRYLPTCSDYAIEAIEQFGVIHGLYLAVKRLARCHPWGGYGYDPIPNCQSSVEIGEHHHPT